MVQHVLFNIFDVPVCTINFHFIQTLPFETSFSQLNEIQIGDKQMVTNIGESIKQNTLPIV